jgi:hypothetical protein
MALGASARVDAVGQRGGPVIVELITVVGDDSYTTGGTLLFEAFVQAALGRGAVTLLGVVQQNIGDLRAMYDAAADSLIVDVMSTGVEVANAADLSSTTFELLVICK